jgi:ferredoxin
VLKKTKQENRQELLTAMMARGPLYAPVREDYGVVYRRVEEPCEVVLDFTSTLQSPKSAFFPQTEDMFKYHLSSGPVAAEALPIPAAETILLGVRPPDAVSFLIMDQLFLGGQVRDPYWEARREATLVIGYPLINAREPEDFWSALGISGADERGSDIFLVFADGLIFFRSLNPKGERLLNVLDGLSEATPEEERIYEAALMPALHPSPRQLAIDPERIARRCEELFGEVSFWEKLSAACISCGTCTFVCPTCHCFDIADETLFGRGLRRRFWDACMFTDFTLEASGHNPRPKIYQRLRQKVCHKYSYYIRKFGCISCVGCGRCTRSCPVNIDIFSMVEAALKG